RAREEAGEGLLVMLAQKDSGVGDPGPDDLYRVGTLARPVQSTALPDGTRRVVLEGLGRVRVDELMEDDDHFRARVSIHARESDDGRSMGTELEALARAVGKQFEEYARLHDRISSELPETLLETRDRVRQAHLISGHLLLSPPEKQGLLETPDLEAHLRLLGETLSRELEILRIEERLDAQIRTQIDRDRRQIYLGEQLKAIQRELGSDAGEDHAELEKAVQEAGLSPLALERAERELARLGRLNPVAPEAAVIRTYLDWIVHLPWSGRSEDNLDVDHAAAILEEAHHGLEEVKQRILDYIAVLSLVGEMQGPILCLVGPPGVGKTSLGESVARCMGRDFVRVSLGGVRDEAEIRGHRRTYVGALPGRILQGMRRVGTTNPVFLLDEVDKLARDFHGDPGAALLEVLDPEQNARFADHYLELDYDLSGVFFLATANTLQGIPEPLRDRMEVIRLPGYLDTEKRTIAQRFLWPRHARDHGLPAGIFSLADETLDRIIRLYTREAGVRELGRQIGTVARKLARQVAEGRLATNTARVVRPEELRALLGPPPYRPPEEEAGDADRTGMANGLAWTAAGGKVLDVEVAAVPGSGKVRLTGTLGDVMKESAMAALTYARARARALGLAPDFHRRIDVHIHIPEGATPKDGPSAGITMAVALVSALTGVPTAPEVALTGEITLRGRVLPVGGVKEKAVAALRHGVRTVVLPSANAPELELLPDEVRAGLTFVPVREMDQVLATAIPALGATVGLERHGDAGISLSQ
ncbi:MAG: endopeptidase La, partial [Gemmatimonadota bacterium]